MGRETISMPDFLEALLDPDLTFLRYAFLLGLIGSIPLGAVGSFVVVRRISYLAAAIAHSVLGGIGVALFLSERYELPWLSPNLGALVAAVVAALLIGRITLSNNQREDAAIGVIWVTGMAVGLIFISKTPGYQDPMSYLFGDILLVSETDLYVATGTALAILGVLLVWHRQIISVCFDREFAMIRDLPANRIYYLLLLLTAVTIVTLVSLVGIVLVIALLTLPAFIASMLTRSFSGLVCTSILLICLFVTLGLATSFYLDVPAGAAIICVAALTYPTIAFMTGGKSAT